jgi:hypothetical protein
MFFSLFSGLPLNGNWFFGYEFTFVDGPEMFLHQYKNSGIHWSNFFNWVVMITTQLSILSFPFVFNKVPYFKLWLFVIPLGFLVTQYHITGPFIFAFCPFILIWLLLLIVKLEKSIMHHSI